MQWTVNGINCFSDFFIMAIMVYGWLFCKKHTFCRYARTHIQGAMTTSTILPNVLMRFKIATYTYKPLHWTSEHKHKRTPYTNKSEWPHAFRTTESVRTNVPDMKMKIGKHYVNFPFSSFFFPDYHLSVILRVILNCESWIGRTVFLEPLTFPSHIMQIVVVLVKLRMPC